jgi:glycosyltransferase involved in cell wall biosynthesis
MPSTQTPLVSLVMPTFKQAVFIRRAIESLLSQSFQDWELIIVNDGSPDNTEQIVTPYLSDPRFVYHALPQNQGIGAALNYATGIARGKYIGYLPSDDVIYPEHVARLVEVLESEPDVYLAYSGVRWNYETYGATLRGDEYVGREAEALLNPPLTDKSAVLNNGNLFAMVQVLHRRDYEVKWKIRTELTSDRLEPLFWRELIERGAKVQYTGAITCEWVVHPDQHIKIVASSEGGLARYRQYYNISHDEPLNWQPSYGPSVDEHERYARFRVKRDLPQGDGLKILLVGELGFNPERIMAFEERGHKLYGLWYPHPESWDSTGPHSYGNITDIPFSPYNSGWIDEIRAIKPDVIYALLNWQAISFIYNVFCQNLGIPFVFHFKEGPFIVQEKGTWHMLIRLLTETDGQIFINQESYEWFQIATHNALDPDRIMIIDGDIPKIDWFTDEWSPKLSERDGEVHTVCAGRIIGIDMAKLAEARVHIHFYGVHFHQMSPNFVRIGTESGYLHPHPTVEPKDWIRELSQYDAAWFHVFDSHNGGDLRRAHWDDLNMPARLGAYAGAGLPWLLKDTPSSRTGLRSIAQQYDFGVFFEDFHHIGELLRDRARVREMTANMQAKRHLFAFDTYVDDLVAFFRRAIDRQKTKAI